MLFALSAFAAPTCFASAAVASDTQAKPTAEVAFHNGDFILAATIAEAKGTTSSLTFAARARIADAITRTESCLDCLLKAQATAEAAIKQGIGANDNDALVQAYVQLAIAIGFHGRLLGRFEARSEGLAEKGRAAIDKALELDPKNPWARAALGGWHLEIVSRAGSLLAATLYGADEDQGLKNFREALASDPNNLLLQYQYALSILALDFDRFQDEARMALGTGYKDPNTDAITKFTRGRTDLLLAMMEHGEERAIKALVRFYQGYRRD